MTKNQINVENSQNKMNEDKLVENSDKLVTGEDSLKETNVLQSDDKSNENEINTEKNRIDKNEETNIKQNQNQQNISADKTEINQINNVQDNQTQNIGENVKATTEDIKSQNKLDNQTDINKERIIEEKLNPDLAGEKEELENDQTKVETKDENISKNKPENKNNEEPVKPVPEAETRKEPVPQLENKEEVIPEEETRKELPQAETKKEVVPEVETKKEPVQETETRKEVVPEVETKKEPVQETETRKEPVPEVETKKEEVPEVEPKEEEVRESETRKEPIREAKTKEEVIPEAETKAEEVETGKEEQFPSEEKIETESIEEINQQPQLQKQENQNERIDITPKTILHKKSEKPDLTAELALDYVFSHQIHLKLGQALYLTGSPRELNNWDINNATRLDCHNNEFWIKSIQLDKTSFPFEYNYFISDYSEIHQPVKFVLSENIKVNQNHYEILANLLAAEKVLRVLTFNLRYENSIDDVNLWNNRRDLAVNTLFENKFDILSIQEGKLNQVNFLKDHLNSLYSYVGRSRTHDPQDEQCGIFINNQKFIILDWGQFWLSETPEVEGSISFGNSLPRIATWAYFKKIKHLINETNKKEYFVFNTHFDHQSQESRVDCTRVLIREIENILNNKNSGAEKKEIILTGSFYSQDEDEPIRIITQNGFCSTSLESGDRRSTFHEFTGRGKFKYDHIFYKVLDSTHPQNRIDHLTANYNIIDTRTTFNDREVLLSDHFIVEADLVSKIKTN